MPRYGMVLSVCTSVPFGCVSNERKLAETSNFEELFPFAHVNDTTIFGGHYAPLNFRVVDALLLAEICSEDVGLDFPIR